MKTGTETVPVRKVKNAEFQKATPILMSSDP